MTYLEFLQKLKETRKKNGFSQRQLATAMHKSAQYISFVENNKTPLKVEDYLLFCDILKIHPSSLFDGVIPQGEFRFLEKKLANLSQRDFRLLKDIITLMELNEEDL